MPRRHARTELGATPHPDERPAPARLAALDRAGALLGRLARLIDAPLLPSAERRRLRVRWGRHVPAVARRLADLMEGERGAFSRLPFRGADLRLAEQEILVLSGLKATLDRLSDLVADALLCRKAALHDRVQAGVGLLRAQLDGPLADPRLAARLRGKARPLLAQLESRQEAIRDKRRARGALPSIDAPPALAAAPRVPRPGA